MEKLLNLKNRFFHVISDFLNITVFYVNSCRIALFSVEKLQIIKVFQEKVAGKFSFLWKMLNVFFLVMLLKHDKSILKK